MIAPAVFLSAVIAQASPAVAIIPNPVKLTEHTQTGSTYLDYAQSRDPGEPVGQTALLTLDKVYAFEPYVARLSSHLDRLRALDVNFRPLVVIK
jgi:hypothetical protein